MLINSKLQKSVTSTHALLISSKCRQNHLLCLHLSARHNRHKTLFPSNIVFISACFFCTFHFFPIFYIYLLHIGSFDNIPSFHFHVSFSLFSSSSSSAIRFSRCIPAHASLGQGNVCRFIYVLCM